MANPHSIFYELQLQRVLSVIQRCLEPGGITEHQAIKEITAIVEPWPQPGNPREQHFPGAMVPPAQYAKQLLGSCANWLETRSRASVSAMEFEGGLMRGYARDLRKVQALLDGTQAPEGSGYTATAHQIMAGVQPERERAAGVRGPGPEQTVAVPADLLALLHAIEGASDHDDLSVKAAALADWLRSHGLSIDSPAAGVEGMPK